MQKNMGGADVFIRTLVGIAFLVNIIILETGVVGTIILLVLGLVSLATAWVAFCPLYKPLGVCTCTGNCCCADTNKAE